SGSGKSTLMAIIGCLDSPTEGSYAIDGTNVEGLSGAALARIRNEKVGFVFQNYNLLPKASIARNVELPLLYAGVGRKERRRRALELLEPVAIPRACGNTPALLLADEPTGALDSKTGEEVLALFKELHRQGNSVMLVTHDAHIASLAERRVELHDGLIVSDVTEKRAA